MGQSLQQDSIVLDIMLMLRLPARGGTSCSMKKLVTAESSREFEGEPQISCGIGRRGARK